MGLYEGWAAAARPERVALTTDRERIDYRTLHARVRRACGWIRASGLGPGDVLALAMPKDPAFLELALGCLRSGVVALPLNDRYTARELGWPLENAGARVAVLPDDAVVDTRAQVVRASAVRAELDAAEPFDPAPVEDHAVALLLYTSGTTGRPKGVPSTHAQVGATVEALRTAWGWSADDVLLHALPQHHVHGLVVGAFGALAAGAHQIWLDRFDAAEVLDHLERGPATVFMGVPTFHARLVHEPPRDLRRVRLVTSGSAGLPAAVHRAFAEAFGVPVVERYGMTEIGIVVSNPLVDPRPGWIGRPLPGVRVRLVDGGRDVAVGEVGELWVSAPSVFDGYWNDPEATAAARVDGWMCTGDLGVADADGWLRLVGRRSELILVGGFNVYPAEVEGELLALPGIREAAVVGVPDPDLGEVPVAAVVGSVDPEAVRAQLRRTLTGYKVPRRIVVVDALPRNAMGKVAKRVLSDTLRGPEGR